MTINILTLAAPIFLGISIIVYIWKDEQIINWGLTLFLGTGLGLGINALLFFIYLHFVSTQKGYDLLLLLLLIGILPFIVLAGYRKTPKCVSYIKRKAKVFSWEDFFWIFILTVIITLSSITFIILVKYNIYGEWDAWAMYTKTARFIFRANVNWRNAFSPLQAFHPDYPPLIALNIASMWAVLQNEHFFIPILISGVFIMATAGLLFTSVTITQSYKQAILALGTLLTTTNFIRVSAAQLSDIPLSFFILATVILFYINSTTKTNKTLILAGITSGLAAWTKNEGVLFVLTTSLALVVVYYKDLQNTLKLYALGLLLPIALLIFFKLSLAPANDLFVNPAKQLFLLLNLERHKIIATSFIKSFSGWGNWIVLVLYGIVMKIQITKANKSGITLISIILLLQGFGYYLIFLITPHDISWHLYTAASRILLQFAPAFFFLYFSVLTSPQNLFKKVNIILKAKKSEIHK